MIRAAAGGSIDFNCSDPFDRKWPIKLNLLLNQVEKQQTLEYLKFNTIRHLLLLGAGVLSNESLDYHFESSKDAFAGYLDVLLDRKPEDERERKRAIATAWTLAWEQQFGDLNDPKTHETIDAVASWLKQQRAEAV